MNQSPTCHRWDTVLGCTLGIMVRELNFLLLEGGLIAGGLTLVRIVCGKAGTERLPGRNEH